MSLQETLQAKVGEAMKAGRRLEVDTLRFLMSAVKNRAIELGPQAALSDAEVLDVIAKQVKQRRESVAGFEKGGRAELAAKERAEMDLLAAYLPAGLSDAELDALVVEAVAAAGAAGPGDVGKVMKVLMPNVKGRADGGAVQARVKAKLGGA
ncbi:MAG: GatB/YqeY domain-containing protein [bacterium]